jgi:para-nitrobenzyl esterase
MTKQLTPIIDTVEGKLQGSTEGEAFAFLGIPYARPPVGDLRWRAPAPVAPWTAIHRADPRIPEGDDRPEDCLYLDLWTPYAGSGSPRGLPVMVWLDCGDRRLGAGGQTRYTGAPLASRGAVVVTVCHRLGRSGYFAHPGLEAESPGGPANFALLDQIAALEWVQRNIARFGGDPDNVTILGQSAGAKSVLALFASPLTRARPRSLFHRGVAHSPYGLAEVGRSCALARAAHALGPDLTAAQLRAIPAAELARRLPDPTPVPICGDPVLPISIHDAFRAGQEAALPLILGSTSDDASVVESFGFTATQILERIGAAGYDLGPMYAEIEDEAELARQVARDALFTIVPRRLGDEHCKRAPTWRYYFDHVPAALRDRCPGARHGADVPYAMASAAACPGQAALAPSDRELQRRMSAYWLAFARTGRPGNAGGVEWQPHAGLLQDVTLLLQDPLEAQHGFMGWRMAAFVAGDLGNLPLPPDV